jgi:hypothetical protein
MLWRGSGIADIQDNSTEICFMGFKLGFPLTVLAVLYRDRFVDY